jgi:outer membrane protein TolC
MPMAALPQLALIGPNIMLCALHGPFIVRAGRFFVHSFHMRRRTALALVSLLILLAAAALPVAAIANDGRETVSLAQVLEAALGQGPDIRQSELQKEISRLQYDQAKARDGLSLKGTAGANRADVLADSRSETPWNPRTKPSDTAQASLGLAFPLTTVSVDANHRITETDPLAQSTSLSLSISRTIWDGYPGGQARASVQQAEIAMQSRALASESDRRDIALKVSQAYYAVLSAQRTLGLRQDAVGQREEELKKTQALYESGTAAAVELKQAEINLGTARLDLDSAGSSLRTARVKLSNLAGWPADRDYDVAEAEDPAVPSLDLAALVQTALSRRADLKQAALTVRTGEISLALKKAQSSPTISASGGATLSHAWDAKTDLATWSLGLQGSLPIVDAGLAAAQTAEAAKQNEISRLQQVSLAASIAASVEEAAASVRDLKGRVEIARASLQVAEMKSQLAVLQFQQGTGSQLDVLTASVNLSSARASLEKAGSDAQVAVLQLQNAIGY